MKMELHNGPSDGRVLTVADGYMCLYVRTTTGRPGVWNTYTFRAEAADTAHYDYSHLYYDSLADLEL